MKIAHPIVCWSIRVGTRLLCRIDQAPLEQIPPRGPLILVLNHIGSLEVPLLYAHLQPRPVNGWAKIETWDSPFMGWLFDLWDAIPIRRGELDLAAIRRAMAVLEAGGILAIAPEGTRSRDGKLQRARPGVVVLALHSGAPILPVAHWGDQEFSGNIKRLKRTDFHLQVGKPFYLDSRGVKVTHEVRQAMVDEIMYQIAGLMPGENRGAYSRPSTDNYIRYI